MWVVISDKVDGDPNRRKIRKEKAKRQRREGEKEEDSIGANDQSKSTEVLSMKTTKREFV